MTTKKIQIQLSDVVKKDLRLIGFLIVFGAVTILSEKYLQAGELSVLFGATANYIAYRIREELNKEGYTEIIKRAIK